MTPTARKDIVFVRCRYSIPAKMTAKDMQRAAIAKKTPMNICFKTNL